MRGLRQQVVNYIINKNYHLVILRRDNTITKYIPEAIHNRVIIATTSEYKPVYIVTKIYKDFMYLENSNDDVR